MTMRYRPLGGTGMKVGGRRDDVVLATKVHFPMGDDVNRSGNSRRWIVAEVEHSLRRLGTDWIDLYQVHRPDESTDLEETLAALTDLVRQGKIRAFGCSTFPAEQLVESHRVAEQRGLYRFRTEQPPYSMLARGIEADVLPVCRRYGMGVLVWSPLAWGFLSGRYRKGRPVDLTSGRAALRPGRFDPADPANAAQYDAVERFVAIAESIGATLPELAIAFTVAHPGVTSAIIGPRTMAQFESAARGAALVLDDETLDRIDEVVAPGVNVYDPGAAFPPPVLTDPVRRRRPVAERAASG